MSRNKHPKVTFHASELWINRFKESLEPGETMTDRLTRLVEEDLARRSEAVAQEQQRAKDLTDRIRNHPQN